MKRFLVMAAVAAMAMAAHAGLASLELRPGENPVAAPAKAVALQAISTNAAGTVTLKKVTRLKLEWEELRTVTNETYATAWSNLTQTVTNDIVSAWRTNAVVTVATNGTTNIVVTTNFLARVVNATPNYPYADLLITTNRVETSEIYTNVAYQAVTSRRVTNVWEPRRVTKEVTNDLANVTLSGGFKTNAVECLLLPGDVIVGSGTAFKGGRVQLIVER